MKKQTSGKLSGSRGMIQAAAFLLSNLHLANFFRGEIYQGSSKIVCVPGLNCYSCPAAAGACPIGALQAVAGSSKFNISYYLTGILIVFGVLLGRAICGFLCPFGWFQDLLHRIPARKFSTKRLWPLRYLKYVVLAVTVLLLPVVITNDLGLGDPFFCKYICPQGILEGAIPLAITNSSIRGILGKLFVWKLTILIALIVAGIMVYRPFCKWLCPLGAIYSLFNRVAFMRMEVSTDRCDSCGRCAESCRMDVDVRKTPDHAECIRCGACIKACPKDAICFRYGSVGGRSMIHDEERAASAD